MVWNFSAGPAMLPPPVLARAREELLDWQGRGVSVMEVSHRGAPFMAMAEACEARLRGLAQVPDDYAVLFLQGGASTQFGLLPQNYARQDQAIAFQISGHWAEKALSQAELMRSCRRVPMDGLPAGDDLAYCHRTSNETVDGWQFHHDPEAGGVPVFCDMSSDILSRPLDLTRYGLVYAGAQKNIGPAGLTLVIVRRDLLGRCPDSLPTLLNHRAMAESGSMANTPPTFAWYLADLVFQWIEDLGGLSAMASRNAEKAGALYDYIDNSGFYRNDVAVDSRSLMNVVFQPPEASQCARFVAEAEDAGLMGLKGHRAVGGLRASLYNAMPLDGVRTLIQFMSEFARRYG